MNKEKTNNEEMFECKMYITDNKDFYKNKNIGLTLSEVDGLLEILSKVSKESE